MSRKEVKVKPVETADTFIGERLAEAVSHAIKLERLTGSIGLGGETDL